MILFDILNRHAAPKGTKMDFDEQHLPQTMTKAMDRIPDWFDQKLKGRPAVTMEYFSDDVSTGTSLMPASTFYWSMLTIVNADRLGIRAIVDGVGFDVIGDMTTRFGPEFADRAVAANSEILTHGVQEEMQ